jgi:hypothetical protein
MIHDLVALQFLSQELERPLRSISATSLVGTLQQYAVSPANARNGLGNYHRFNK